MLIIPKGTDPNTVNETTIAFDKSILKSMDDARPVGGYPPEQEAALEKTRKRIADYEAQHGVVNPDEVSERQEQDFNSKLKFLEGLTKAMGIE